MAPRKNSKRAPGARLVTASLPTLTPRPPHLFVRRPKLDDFLDGSLDTPVSMVVAPAGWGKTATAAAWTRQAHDRGIDVRWLRTAEFGQLVTHLRDSARAGSPETSTTAPQSDLTPDDAAARVVEAAAHGHSATATAERPVLVVDDAQQLPPTSVRLLTRVLTDCPDAVRLLLLSRRDLEFVPVSLTLNGQARTLRAGDLRLDDAEAADLVRAHHPEVGTDELAALLEQGDGWAAALVLAARTAQGSAVPAGTRASLAATTQPMLDYLMGEVFDTFSPDLQQVLLSTSQERQVTAEEAVVLSGVPEAAEHLANAAAQGLLVTSYDSEHAPTGHAWRFHPLLIELLRRRTGPSGSGWTTVVEAHERAAHHYLERRDAAPATRHAGLTGDLGLQLRALRELAPELITRNQGHLVADALSAIPVEVREQLPQLLALEAFVLLNARRFDAAKVAADRALAGRIVATDPTAVRDIEADLATLELWQARYGWRGWEPARTRAERALGCAHDTDDPLAAHDSAGMSPLRSTRLMAALAALEIWVGDLDTAAIHIQGVDLYARQVDLPTVTRMALSLRATLEMVHGSYQSSLHSAEAALELGDGTDMTGMRAHLMRGWAKLHELELDQAADELSVVKAAPRDSLDPLLLVYRRLLDSCLLMARGEVEAARRLLDTRGDVPNRLPAFAERHTRWVRMMADGFMGDLPALDTDVHQLSQAGRGPDATAAHAIVVGLRGEELTAVHQLDELLSDPTVPAAIAASAAASRVAFLLRSGTPASKQRARTLVPDLLTRVATQRLLWILSTGSLISPAFTDLLAAEADDPSGHPFSREALSALRQVPHPYSESTFRPQGRGAAADSAGLTPREVEVLRQLSLGGNNADIARSLFISENTVKTHLASIYRKLDVDRRVDALRAARARHLL